MLFAVAKLYILRKIDKDLPPFFIVCDGGDGRWLAYGSCRSGVQQLPFGRIAIGRRSYGSCSTVTKRHPQPSESMYWVRTQCHKKT